MIFQFTWEKVLSGEKTQTRRLIKDGEYTANIYGIFIPDINEQTRKYGDLWDKSNPYHTSSIGPHVASPGGKRKWEIGKTYAVQPGRGKKGVARIEITGIRREDVREISYEDARAEGFDTDFHFLRTWAKMHDKPAYTAWINDNWGDGDESGIVLATKDWHSWLKGQRPAERYTAWVLEFKLIQKD